MKKFALQLLGLLIIATQGRYVSALAGPYGVATVHGTAVSQQFPWHVIIKEGDKAVCGGSVLSDSWVVTAGQCCAGHKSLDLIFGSISVSDDKAVTMTATELHVHPEHDKLKHKNDICLIKLPETLQFSKTIGPLKMLRSAVTPESLVGNIGATSGVGETTDGKLLWGQVTVEENSECDAVYTGQKLESTLCVKGYDKIPFNLFCRGEPGSALIVQDDQDGRWMQIGINTQLITERCASDTQLLFTSLAPFLDFIYTTTALPRN